jgi:hypothetical protein
VAFGFGWRLPLSPTPELTRLNSILAASSNHRALQRVLRSRSLLQQCTQHSAHALTQYSTQDLLDTDTTFSSTSQTSTAWLTLVLHLQTCSSAAASTARIGDPAPFSIVPDPHHARGLSSTASRLAVPFEIVVWQPRQRRRRRRPPSSKP